MDLDPARRVLDHHPKAVLWVVVAVTLITARGFFRLSVDTDPENMLAADHPVRVLNAEVGERFGIGDTIIGAERLDVVVGLHHDITSSLRSVAFFGEPARALTRNALIIAIGFTPLFLSSLVPYVVVGAFLAAIILLSWLVTLVGLPAVTSSARHHA